MRRLPSIALLVVVAGLAGCARDSQVDPMNPNPNKRFQKDDTAYISVFMYKDSSGTCKAKVSPETLLVVKPQGKPPSKLNVEWEVVNLCWDQNGAAEEVTITFLNDKDPTERYAPPKDEARMPNPDSGALDTSRDQIRRKLKINPGAGEYDYLIKRKVGAQTYDVVDPRIEYEYR